MTGPRLAGWRVLIGRAAGRSNTLIRRLAAEGAAAQAVPFIDILPPEDDAGLDSALLTLSAGDVDWVAFGSVNAVTAVLDRADALKLHPPVPAGVRVAAVGPATAAAIRARSVAVDLVPSRGGSARSLGIEFPTAHPDQSVLLPHSAIAAQTLPDALRRKGYRVLPVVAYRTAPRALPLSVHDDLAAGLFEAVVVASPSGVRALAGRVLGPHCALVAIGEPTARALSDAGMPAAAVASSPTDKAIVQALADIAAAPREQGEASP